jgi:gamma-glutamylputrescine oxidase
MIANFGIDRARQLWAFAEAGVGLIRSNIRQLQIACDHQVQDSLVVAADDRGAQHVADEHGARTTLGYPSTHYGAKDLPAVVGTRAFQAGVRYPDCFGIDSYRYCRAMRDVLASRGALVFEGTRVTEVLPGLLRAAGRTVSTGHVILCADRCIPDLSPLQDQIGQVQTFLAISKPLRDDQVRAVFPGEPVMAWDSKLTYNYFRLTGEQRLLVGGADLWQAYALRERHDPARNLKPLSAFVARTFPALDVEWDQVWPGMLGVTKDFLPVAGNDARIRSLTYIGAAAGLPWAAALGCHVARAIAAGKVADFPEFSPYRRAVRATVLNRVLTRRGALAVAHASLVARSL